MQSKPKGSNYVGPCPSAAADNQALIRGMIYGVLLSLPAWLGAGYLVLVWG
jgi:hypothetical protein